MKLNQKTMILLSKDDIRKVFNMSDAIEAVKRSYKLFSEGGCNVPLRTIINSDKGDFCFMPSYSREMNSAAMKVVNVFPGNPEKGLPGSIGQVLLIDGTTGKVNALIDGTYVTAIRTAAASGSAFDLFGIKDAQTGALIGTGSQALLQLEAMLASRPVREVRVAARNFDKTRSFVEKAKKELAVYEAEIIACESPDDAVNGADLVTLVTVSKTPVCSAKSFKTGCTISAVGSYAYDMQELDPAIFEKTNKIYFDSAEAVLAESGDIIKPLEQGLLKKESLTGDIGDYILGKIPGRETEDEIIIFKNVGIGVLDLVTAAEIYNKAVKADIGLKWGE